MKDADRDRGAVVQSLRQFAARARADGRSEDAGDLTVLANRIESADPPMSSDAIRTMIATYLNQIEGSGPS